MRANMYKTIGVLAHVDAGKTTFSEQLLFQTNAIKHIGRVDHHNTFLDNHELERTRGITIFAEQGRFTYHNDVYHLIDTPGHVDFSPEMERSIRVMDAAVIIISAVEGVQGHTETVWQLLRKHRVPTFIFLNKIDREGANIDGTMQQIQQLLSGDAVLYDADFVSAVAERHDQIFEQFLEDDIEHTLYEHVTAQLIEHGELVPVVTGIALKGEGISTMLDLLHRYIHTQYDLLGEFQALIFKIRHEQDQRLAFAKATQGTLHVRDDIMLHGESYKITELRLYNGQRFEKVQTVHAGELFAMKGLPHANVGDAIAQLTTHEPTVVPTLKVKLLADTTIHVKEVLKILQQLEAEEPTLKVIWHERLQEIHLHIMGVIQLEVLTHILKQRYHLAVQFDEPTILYLETIATDAYGYGHFEPLKHYAEVHLHLASAPRGHGLSFTNKCHADNLSIGHMRLIEQHVFEQQHHGLLTGSPVTDIHITLLNGAAHKEHTEGGDFREATHRALRQGLEQAHNILLEPIYHFRMRANAEHIGRMMSDIQQAHGTFDAPELTEQHAFLTGTVPVATFMNYATTFAAYTNGKGAISLQFGGYEQCHNTEEVIDKINYQKDADPDYSSNSIFCAKGKGYTVPWQQAAEAMHCEKKFLEK